MTNQPEYRILIRIYDRETDTTIALEDAPLFVDDEQELEAQASRVLAAYKRRKEAFEESYYPEPTAPDTNDPSQYPAEGNDLLSI